MALFRTGYYVFKSLTPVLTSPGFMIPSTVNNQVRNAARKGYREKKLRKKLAEKQKKLASAPPQDLKSMKLQRRRQEIEKTVNLKKPEPPNDDIFITSHFNYKKYTLSEAIEFHKEYHHPTMFNNREASVSVRCEIDMTGKKETQVLKPFYGNVTISHPFVIKQTRDVMVFCQPEDVKMCVESGASVAGGLDLIKKVQEGIILPSSYDYVIAHTSMLPELVPIRGLLKDQLPRLKKGNLTADLKAAIRKFRDGIEYQCEKYETAHNFGVVEVNIGKIDMPTEHIVENFKDLLNDILSNRPTPERDFITWIWCFSPPSDERFAIDLSTCIPDANASKNVEKAEEVVEKTEVKA